MLQARWEVFPELDLVYVLAYLDNLVENSSHLPLNYTGGWSLGCMKPQWWEEVRQSASPF